MASGARSDLTGPRDRAVVNEDLLKELLIPQRRESARQLFRPQPRTPRHTVFESNKEAVVRLRFHFNYVPIHALNASSPIRRRQSISLHLGRSV